MRWNGQKATVKWCNPTIILLENGNRRQWRGRCHTLKVYYMPHARRPGMSIKGCDDTNSDNLKEPGCARPCILISTQVTGEFPTHRSVTRKKASIWWRHHDFQCFVTQEAGYKVGVPRPVLRALFLLRSAKSDDASITLRVTRVNSPHKGPVTWTLMFLLCGSACAVKQTVECPVI